MGMRPRKRLLIGLLSAGLLVIGLALVGIMYVVLYVPELLSQTLRWVAIAGMVTFVPLFGVGVTMLVWTLATGRSYPGLLRLMQTTITVLMPIACWLGRIVGVSRDAINRSFIEINNRLVRIRNATMNPSRLLVLLPHCMQAMECKVRVEGNIDNCARCGQCRIGDIAEMGDKFGVQIAVASGGGQARLMVKRARPRAVIAVACEQELVDGLRDVKGIPVMAVLNKRPHGPCVHTDADVELVRAALLDFISGTGGIGDAA